MLVVFFSASCVYPNILCHQSKSAIIYEIVVTTMNFQICGLTSI